VTPVVAVSGLVRTDGGRERVALNVAYPRALREAGLAAVVVPPLLDARDAAAVIQATSGLVLSGGEDVDPARYGAAPHPALGPTAPARDAAELALIAAARDAGRPILAICRGLQILNVALGGTLYQDLPSERPGPIPHQGDDTARHQVRIAPGSLLHRTLGVERATVNSRHHQAVRELAKDLAATAWSDDGVIEAVERARPAAWLLGVQWHPEDLGERALFRAFAAAVSGRPATASAAPAPV